MLYITTTPPPVLTLLLTNLPGYRGPTIVKPVLCLESDQWAWAVEDFRQRLHCLVEVPPLLPSPYKSSESHVTSGEAGCASESTHLHHALGTSQVWAHALIHTLLSCFPCCNQEKSHHVKRPYWDLWPIHMV